MMERFSLFFRLFLFFSSSFLFWYKFYNIILKTKHILIKLLRIYSLVKAIKVFLYIYLHTYFHFLFSSFFFILEINFSKDKDVTFIHSQPQFQSQSQQYRLLSQQSDPPHSVASTHNIYTYTHLSSDLIPFINLI